MINLMTIKTTLIIGGIGLLFIVVLSWQLKSAWKENTKLEVALDSAAETIIFQSQERVKIENINTASKKRLEKLKNETDKLHDALQSQTLTEQQKTCDATTLIKKEIQGTAKS